MLRQKYMKKYKEKSKYDDIRFIKEDDLNIAARTVLSELKTKFIDF